MNLLLVMSNLSLNNDAFVLRYCLVIVLFDYFIVAIRGQPLFKIPKKVLSGVKQAKDVTAICALFSLEGKRMSGELKQTTLTSHRILRIPIVGKGLYEF